MKIIVAYTKQNRVIGNKNALPWGKLKGDLPRFKELTTGNTVIMGRKTWESLPPNKDGTRFLPNRKNLVITRNPDAYQFKVKCDEELNAPDVVENNELRGQVTLNLNPKFISFNIAIHVGFHENVFIIGGEQIYRKFLELKLVDEIIASEVHQEYEGDAFFPILSEKWEIVETTPCEGYDLVRYISHERF